MACAWFLREAQFILSKSLSINQCDGPCVVFEKSVFDGWGLLSNRVEARASVYGCSDDIFGSCVLVCCTVTLLRDVALGVLRLFHLFWTISATRHSCCCICGIGADVH